VPVRTAEVALRKQGRGRGRLGFSGPVSFYAVSAIYIVCTAVSDWLGRLRSQLSQELSATPGLASRSPIEGFPLRAARHSQRTELFQKGNIARQ